MTYLYQRNPETGLSVPPTSYPQIPAAHYFQHHYGHEMPMCVFGWQWSCTFHCWSALVLFYDGWQGFTYPAWEGFRR
jgi:hypothetical protein